MLTARQYEGIGRFTIAFNEIDEVVKAYVPLVEKYSKCVLPAGQARLQTFHTRLDSFRKVLKAASATDQLAGAYAANILKVLDTVSLVAAKRNEYVHAVAFIDFSTNTRMLQTRSGNVLPDEKQIFDLANQSAFMASKLAEECEALLRMYIGTNKSLSEFTSPDEQEGDEMAE